MSTWIPKRESLTQRGSSGYSKPCGALLVSSLCRNRSATNQSASRLRTPSFGWLGNCSSERARGNCLTSRPSLEFHQRKRQVNRVVATPRRTHPNHQGAISHFPPSAH